MYTLDSYLHMGWILLLKGLVMWKKLAQQIFIQFDKYASLCQSYNDFI